MTTPTELRFVAMNDDFSSVAAIPDGSGGPVGPFLSAGHFRMSQPTFPPHPHAGFSAVTYVLEGSPESVLSRDSLGDQSVIRPGGLHWTSANSGIVHEETPLRAGGTVDGLQVFVNHPSVLKRAEPSRFHARPDEIPTIQPSPGVRIRVLAGAYQGAVSQAPVASPLLWLQVDVAAGAAAVLPIDPSFEGFAYVERGRAVLTGADVPSPGGYRFDHAGGLEIAAANESTRVFVFAGTALGEPVVARGPMIMNNEEDIDAVFRRFRKGELGSLSPRVYDRHEDELLDEALLETFPASDPPAVARGGGS